MVSERGKVQRLLLVQQLQIDLHQTVKAIQKNCLAQEYFQVARVQAGCWCFQNRQFHHALGIGKKGLLQHGERSIQVKAVSGLPRGVVGAVKDWQGFGGSLVVARQNGLG